MIIFLYGKDTYRSRQKLREIIEHYRKVHKSGLNLRFLDAKNCDPKEISQIVSTMPMFKEKKLVVFYNLFTNQTVQNSFLEALDNLRTLKDLILIYEDGEPRKNDSFFRLLEKSAKTQKFDLLSGIRLKNWVQKEALKYGTRLEENAIAFLASYIGSDLWRASGEIKKLASYKFHSKPRVIQKKDIESLVRPDIDADIFKALDFLSQGRKRETLSIFHHLLEKGEYPLYLLSMIAFQFRNILEVKDAIERGNDYYSILNTLALHPFVIKKSYGFARYFSFEELKKIYQKIFQADLDIKTGKIEPQTALDLLIAEI